jgi:hypothetical protein
MIEKSRMDGIINSMILDNKNENRSAPVEKD